MVEAALQERAAQLAARVDGLARALKAAGVSEENASRLLTRASEAVLHALTLDLLLSERKPKPQGAPPQQPVDEAEPGVPRPAVRLAA
jgi:hypothetical protein